MAGMGGVSELLKRGLITKECDSLYPHRTYLTKAVKSVVHSKNLLVLIALIKHLPYRKADAEQVFKIENDCEMSLISYCEAKGFPDAARVLRTIQ
jgi:hypothetical protein